MSNQGRAVLTQFEIRRLRVSGRSRLTPCATPANAGSDQVSGRVGACPYRGRCTLCPQAGGHARSEMESAPPEGEALSRREDNRPSGPLAGGGPHEMPSGKTGLFSAVMDKQRAKLS